MKVVELRHGGHYFNKYTRKEIVLDLTTMPRPLRYDIGSIEGIPLTEEWLLKFGLDKKNDSGIRVEYFGGTFFHTLQQHLIHYPSDDKYMLKEIVIRAIEYVHELQNLYFALTGTELEIKK